MSTSNESSWPPRLHGPHPVGMDTRSLAFNGMRVGVPNGKPIVQSI